MYNGRPSALSLTGTVGFLDEQYEGSRQREYNDTRVHRERWVDHEQGASHERCNHPPSVSWPGQNSTHSTEITRTYMRESAVAAPQAVPRTDDAYEQLSSITDEIGWFTITFRGKYLRCPPWYGTKKINHGSHQRMAKPRRTHIRQPT